MKAKEDLKIIDITFERFKGKYFIEAEGVGRVAVIENIRTTQNEDGSFTVTATIPKVNLYNELG